MILHILQCLVEEKYNLMFKKNSIFSVIRIHQKGLEGSGEAHGSGPHHLAFTSKTETQDLPVYALPVCRTVSAKPLRVGPVCTGPVSVFSHEAHFLTAQGIVLGADGCRDLSRSRHWQLLQRENYMTPNCWQSIYFASVTHSLLFTHKVT